jgi:hypothetical protein
MKIITYFTSVDTDVKYSNKMFVGYVDKYINDPDGWKKMGYSFKNIENADKARLHIRLVSPETLKKERCDSNLSCAELNGKNVMINYFRWMNGSKESKLNLSNYRQYVISHEVGHGLGYDHKKCEGEGKPAPIMMQQTLGIGACVPNTKV